jgi:hypothetical protein
MEEMRGDQKWWSSAKFLEKKKEKNKMQGLKAKV